MTPQLRRLVLDLGPLIVFFAAYQLAGIFAATAVFMVAISAALLAGWIIEKKLSPMGLVTAAIVLVFGGLTLYFHNAAFLKLKPTLIYLMFSGALLGGLAFDRLFIKYALAFEFDLPEAAWRGLTWRWGLFFLGLAVLNVVVWLNFSESAWVMFKVWLVFPLVLAFALLQTPYMLRHRIVRG